MIVRIPGWSWRVAGDDIALEGNDGALVYRERVRPLRSIRDIIRDVQTRYLTRRALRVHAIEPFVTTEGEYGALATLGDADIERVVAVVYGDDFYALCIGFPAPGRGPPLATRVRDVMVHDSHLLGIRRRRYVYEPPATWVGARSGAFHEVWRALHYPRVRGRLLVFPATPLQEPTSARALLRQLVDHRTTAFDAVEQPMVTSTMLSGTWAQATTGEVIHDVVVLQDDHYTYAMQMQSTLEQHAEHERQLLAAARTIQPIPHPLGAVAAASNVFAWAVD